jgi:hypothetical protein
LELSEQAVAMVLPPVARDRRSCLLSREYARVLDARPSARRKPTR